MAKQRYINTKFWSDNFITSLNPLDRYLFLYFLTNEHTNICGIYEVPLKVMAYETGLESDALLMMIKRLKGRVYYIDGWVYLKNFEKHQAVNDSIKKGIEIAKKEVPEQIMAKIMVIKPARTRLGTASPQDPTYSNLNSNSNSNILMGLGFDSKLENIFKKWNGNLTYEGSCKNTTAKTKLFPECRKITSDIKTAFSKLNEYSEKELVEAMSEYATEVLNRNPKNDYAKHRFSFYEFFTQKNAYKKFINK